MATGITDYRQDRLGLGIGLMLAAWFFFAVTDTSVKWLVVLGLPSLQLAFMRYLSQFTCTLTSGLLSGSLYQQISRRDLALVLVRGALLISATGFNFYALNFLSLTVTSAIMFSSPIIVCALSGPMLGEKVGPWRWFAIGLGFAGVLTVIRPFGQTFHWTSLLILYNAFALAMFSIITRKLSGSISTQTMQFFMGTLGTAVLLPPAILTWENPATPLDWLLMIGIGFWAWIWHEVFSRAHLFAEANVLMPFSYSYIIYMTFGSFLVFSDLPDAMTILGAAIIVVSGLVIWWREKKGRRIHAL